MCKTNNHCHQFDCHVFSKMAVIEECSLINDCFPRQQLLNEYMLSSLRCDEGVIDLSGIGRVTKIERRVTIFGLCFSGMKC